MTSASRLLSLLIVPGVVGTAHAAAPATSVRLEVRAAPECTSQADLTARILARLRRARFGDAAAALGVRARFTTLPSGNVVAELTLNQPGAEPSSRRLVARSCVQAADAAALIVAMTLDPTSISGAPTASEAPEPDESAAVSSPNSLAEMPPKPVPDSNRPRRRREKPQLSPTLEIDDEPSPAAASPSWTGSRRLGAQVAVQALGGVAPELMPSIAAYLLVGLDRAALWSPAMVLGATHGFDASVRATGGTANFWFDAVSLDACALRIRFHELEARGCASALIGRLSANGTDTSNTAGIVRRPFAATGAATILALRVSSVVELTARAAAGVNLIRDSFEFAPVVFHSVPRMTFTASVGIGIRSR